jgi:autoinducer 2 (AI-2) kinase
MHNEYLMALDAGTGAGRCVLMSLDGKHVVYTYEEWAYIRPPQAESMGLSFDPNGFWDILANLSKQAIDKAGISPDQVVGVSSTSQREGCVFLNQAGVEVYAGPNRDMRAAVEGMQIAAQHGSVIYQRTGHYPNGIFMPSRLLWHKTHTPEVYDQIAHVLMINDWILYKLSGEYACEPSNASETCLYDLHTGEWAEDIIQALNLPDGIYPPILDPGTQLGEVTKTAAEKCGLIAGTPVVVGGADTQCGVLGSGAIQAGDTAAVSGTSTPVQMVTARPMIDENERLWAGAHVVPGQFILESNAGGTGSIYQWYRDAFCQAEIAQAANQGLSAYEVMNAAAGKTPPGSGGVQSFMGVGVFNAKQLSMPKNVINVGVAPFYYPGADSKGLVSRAILESLAYATKANLDQIVAVHGKALDELFVCGGSAKSALYLEILSNVTGLPLRVPRWKEATAIGAGICAGVGSGRYADFDSGVANLVDQHTIKPTEDLTKQYRSLYRKWTRTLEGLGKINL